MIKFNQYLAVPFSEKDIVKNMGAKWDNNKKLWYVSENSNLDEFDKWLPNKINPYTKPKKIEGFYIAFSNRGCYKCKKISPVFTFACKNKKGHARVLYYIRHLSDNGQKAILKLSENYYYDIVSSGNPYWMNHCEHCKAKFGDFETVEEFSGSFSPTSKEEAQQISLYKFNEPLEFNACDNPLMYFCCMEVKANK